MKIMYLMHVNWFWIFQRPQIMALYLENDFEVTVFYPKVLLKPLVSRNNTKPQKRKAIIQLPKENLVKIFKPINRFIVRRTIASNVKKFDAVWICHPSQFEFIPEDYGGLVIYDCMDNYVPFAKENNRENIDRLEKALIERSDVIFSSSAYLKDNVIKDKESFLVRNGFISAGIIPPIETDAKKSYIIGYFGTISEWFDFEILSDSLDAVDNIEYRLIGPNDTKMVSRNRVTFEGVVSHNVLGNVIEEYDALIMPFVVNDIILAVDPVKLYEYISFGKCVISVWYPEIERFSPYVYFYKNRDEYIELIGRLAKSGFKPKYNAKQQEEFLKDNTWEKRFETVKKVLLDV